MSTHESWKKAAAALVQHWKTNGPTVNAQWCSDAASLLGFGLELLDAEGREAARYHWLRAEHARVDPCAAVVWKPCRNRTSGEWVNTVGPEWLDSAIDEEIAKAAR
jgi:hypothetical protein